MSAYDHRIPRPAAPVVAGALAGAAFAGYALPVLAGARPGYIPGSPAPIWASLRELLGVEGRTASGRGCALTFEDGPPPQGTPAGRDALARAGAHATFFLVGEQVLRSPALAREIADAGHGIGLHCHRHRNLLRPTPWQVAEDISRAPDAIETSTGRSPRLYRPPYGVLNAAALRLARARGWRTLLWSHWGRDWDRRATPASILARVTDGVQEGAVRLLHDADESSAPGSWERTAVALPRVLDALAARGLALTAP